MGVDLYRSIAGNQRSGINQADSNQLEWERRRFEAAEQVDAMERMENIFQWVKNRDNNESFKYLLQIMGSEKKWGEAYHTFLYIYELSLSGSDRNLRDFLICARAALSYLALRNGDLLAYTAVSLKNDDEYDSYGLVFLKIISMIDKNQFQNLRRKLGY